MGHDLAVLEDVDLFAEIVEIAGGGAQCKEVAGDLLELTVLGFAFFHHTRYDLPTMNARAERDPARLDFRGDPQLLEFVAIPFAYTAGVVVVELSPLTSGKYLLPSWEVNSQDFRGKSS